MLSFIVPVYKTPLQLLRNCLDSVLRYSRPMELVCVLDSPGDACEAVLDAYAVREPRMRLFKNDRNRGVSYSRNRGVANARGGFIAFVDADDEIYAETYEQALNIVVSQNLSACVVTANGQKERRLGVPYGALVVSDLQNVENGGVIAAAYCWAIYPMVIDRNAWLAAGCSFIEDQRFGEDFIAVVKFLCTRGRFAFLNVIGYKSVGHPNSACRGAHGCAPYVQGLKTVRSVLADVTCFGISESALCWYVMHTIPFALFDRHAIKCVKGNSREQYVKMLEEFAAIVSTKCGTVLTAPVRVIFRLLWLWPRLWFLPGMPLAFVLHALGHFKFILRTRT